MSIHIRISIKDGKVEGRTFVHCDGCQEGRFWRYCKIGNMISQDLVNRFMRRDGWKMGKRHICIECQGAGKK